MNQCTSPSETNYQGIETQILTTHGLDAVDSFRAGVARHGARLLQTVQQVETGALAVKAPVEDSLVTR